MIGRVEIESKSCKMKTTIKIKIEALIFLITEQLFYINIIKTNFLEKSFNKN